MCGGPRIGVVAGPGVAAVPNTVTITATNTSTSTREATGTVKSLVPGLSVGVGVGVEKSAGENSKRVKLSTSVSVDTLSVLRLGSWHRTRHGLDMGADCDCDCKCNCNCNCGHDYECVCDTEVLSECAERRDGVPVPDPAPGRPEGGSPERERGPRAMADTPCCRRLFVRTPLPLQLSTDPRGFTAIASAPIGTRDTKNPWSTNEFCLGSGTSHTTLKTFLGVCSKLLTSPKAGLGGLDRMLQTAMAPLSSLPVVIARQCTETLTTAVLTAYRSRNQTRNQPRNFGLGFGPLRCDTFCSPCVSMGSTRQSRQLGASSGRERERERGRARGHLCIAGRKDSDVAMETETESESETETEPDTGTSTDTDTGTDTDTDTTSKRHVEGSFDSACRRSAALSTPSVPPGVLVLTRHLLLAAGKRYTATASAASAASATSEMPDPGPWPYLWDNHELVKAVVWAATSNSSLTRGLLEIVAAGLRHRDPDQRVACASACAEAHVATLAVFYMCKPGVQFAVGARVLQGLQRLHSAAGPHVLPWGFDAAGTWVPAPKLAPSATTQSKAVAMLVSALWISRSLVRTEEAAPMAPPEVGTVSAVGSMGTAATPTRAACSPGLGACVVTALAPALTLRGGKTLVAKWWQAEATVRVPPPAVTCVICQCGPPHVTTTEAEDESMDGFGFGFGFVAKPDPVFDSDSAPTPTPTPTPSLTQWTELCCHGKHWFHLDCVTRWFATTTPGVPVALLCPLCKTDVWTNPVAG